MRPPRGVSPVLLLLAAAACAGPQLLPERPADPVEARIAAVVEKTLFAVPMVDERAATVRAYLEGGLGALAMRDAALHIAVLEPALRVSLEGGRPVSVPLPYGWEGGAEGKRAEIGLAAARAVGEARRLSPALAALGAPAVEEIFLRGALGRIDPEGRVFRGREQPPSPARSPGGPGLILRPGAEGAEVAEVVAGSPADQAGIGRGERLVSIDGWRTRGHGVEEATSRLQGELGSRVRLALLGRAGERTLELQRHRVVPLLARPEALGSGLVLLRPLGLGGGLGRALYQAMRDPVGGGPAAGAVLDLRGNPGGPPAAAAEVASLFVERGRLYAVAGRDPSVAEKSAGDTPFARLALVLLVDEGSAGGAELLAASLQDHHRAVLVGSRTAGRGVVQVTHELGPSPDDLQLVVTAGRLARPGGARIQGLGVQPDLCTSLAPPRGAPEAELPALLARPRGDCPRRRLEPEPGAGDRELSLAVALLRSPALREQALRAPAAR